MSNSTLATVKIPSPNCGNYINGVLIKNRLNKIQKITIHHTAGVVSVETLGRIFADPSRSASANYGIGNDGRIALYVDESIRAWTSGSSDNDNQAITIETSNNVNAYPWTISAEAEKSLIALCVDICRRNKIAELKFTGNASGNLTFHKFFQATNCPGEYIESIIKDLVKAINEQINPKEPEAVKIYRVQVGAYKVKANAVKMQNKLKAGGYSTIIVENGGIYRVQVGAYKEKANAEKMMNALIAEGYKPFIVEAEIISTTPAAPKKTVDELAKEVILGKWGVGSDRKKRLTDAGYDYNAVQRRVDELMK